MDPSDIKCLKKYKAKVKEAERKTDFQEEAFYSSVVADLYSKYGEYDEALEHYQRALSLYEGLNKEIDIAVACRLLGECYCKTGELDKALCLHKKYLSLASKCHDEVEEQRALTTIGNTHRSRHEVANTKQSKVDELEKAKAAFIKSLELCECLKKKGSIMEKDYNDMKGRLLYNLGLVYGDLGDMDASLQYLNKALPIFQSISSLDILYLCQRALSDLHVTNGKLTSARKLLEDACKTARRSKDKISEGDAMLAKALVHVQLEEFPSCRHILKKLHYMKGTAHGETREVIKVYKSVRLYETLLTRLKQSSEGDIEARIPLYEKLADCSVDMSIIRLALYYYKKQLSASVSANVDPKELLSVHISLAQTYEDGKQYDKAIDHYRQEIDCRGDDHEQICRSWLNIALNQENSGVKYKVIQTSYVNAYNSAKRAGHRKLQARSLTALVELFKIHKDEKALEKTQEQLEHIRTKYQITDTQIEDESQAIEEYVDLGDVGEASGGDDDADDDASVMSELTESEYIYPLVKKLSGALGGGEDDADDASVMSELTESEDEEEKETVNIRAVRRGGKKALIFERNKLGETPLHRACIKGNLKEVKHLISRGHPLNPQDNNGWTPLHEATNNGHLDITECLVQHGADINNRGGQGCKGTTPLIDAATNGHIEIMDLLIKHGANVVAKDDHGQPALYYFEKVYRDNKGDIDKETGVKCDNMVQLLREKMPEYRGSSGKRPEVLSQLTTSAHVPSVTQTTGRKSVTTRPAVTAWRSRNDVIMGSDSDSDASDIPVMVKRKSQPLVLEDTDNSENIYRSFSDDADEVVDQSGADAYKEAISTVGRSARRAVQPSQAKTSKRSSTEDRPALLNEEELLGDDDWLEDDLRKPIVRRKNMTCNGYLSTGGVRKRNRSDSLSPIKKTDKTNKTSTSKAAASSQKKRIRIEDSDIETDTTGEESDGFHIVMDTSDDEINDTITNQYSDIGVMFNDDDDNLCVILSQENDVSHFGDSSSKASATSHTSVNNKFSAASHTGDNFSKSGQSMKRSSQKQSKMTDFGHVENISATSVTKSNSNQCQLEAGSSSSASQLMVGVPMAAREKSLQGVLRIKVKVEETLLLIPVIDLDHSKTFSWLSEEVSSRYYQMRGVKLKLTLGKDGAHFAPSDLVTLMLEDNDKIESFCESRDQQPPMANTYQEACKTLKLVLYKNVQSLLQTGEVSGRVNLSDLVLRAAQFQPVIKAIQHQTCLRELELKGNRLGDVGLENLCKVLSSVPNLTHLGLACNDISVEGLKLLSSTATADNSIALQNITSVDMSYNPLYDGSLVHVAAVIQGLPMLTKLSLASCYLTVKFFQCDRLKLTEALHKSSVQHFNISYNQLGCVGVELFLKCQNPTRGTSLDLSGTVSDNRSSQVYRHLYNYASQDGCVLQELYLCNCHLTMDDADFFSRLPSIAKHLQKISISGNPRLQNLMLQQLVQASTCETSSLEEIFSSNCGIAAPLSVEFLDCLTEKLSSSVPLRRLEFSCTKLEKLDMDSLGQVWTGKYEEFAVVKFTDDNVILSVADR